MESELSIKKKGRPKKEKTEEPVQELSVQDPDDQKKKRGRKKKEIVILENPETVPKKKRGRKAQLKYFSSSIRKRIPFTPNVEELSILTLDLDPAEVDDKFPFSSNTQTGTNEINETQTPHENKTNYTVLENVFENPCQNSHGLLCWWCCHEFDNVCIGMPVDYTRSKLFRVKGHFCGFPCMIAYKQSLRNLSVCTDSLIKLLFKKLTGIIVVPDTEEYRKAIEAGLSKTLYGHYNETNNVNTTEYINKLVELSCDRLLAAPPRETLKAFGGKLTIEEFRAVTGKGAKIFKLIEYPMFISRDYIEEVDIETLKSINPNVFKEVQTARQPASINKVTLPKTNVVTSSNSIDRFLKFT